MEKINLQLSATTFLVYDYDEAIQWFVNVLGFVLQEDTDLGGGKRWVCVAAPQSGVSLLLAKAKGEEQLRAVGRAAGGRVAFFLRTSSFETTHRQLAERGVRFREHPRHESYGMVCVFEDLYGNAWDLIG